MVLLHLFVAVRERLGVDLAVAHLDHGLRGRRGERDREMVRRSSRALGLRCHVARVNVKRRATLQGESIEEAGRHARYGFFDRLAVRYGYDHVCTAHHADDQSETVLARLVKGAGWRGLAGIRETRGLYVRPLLGFRRAELSAYASDRQVRFREDHTNRDTRYFRNRIRHDLLPLLRRRFDPKIDRHLEQIARIASDIEKGEEERANRLFTRLCRQRGAKIVLEIKPLRRYLFAQKQALYRLIFESLRVRRTLTFDDFERLDGLLTNSQSGRRVVIGGIECLHDGKSAVFCRKGSHPGHSFRYEHKGDGSREWPEWGFGLKITHGKMNDSVKRALGRRRNIEWVDADAVHGRLIVRSWKAGDRFHPLGMNHDKKLSDFFSDEKIPLTERRHTPLLCVRRGKSERIVWICGHRIDHRCRITETTTHILKLEYTRERTDD